jgi:hypothetical protein
MENPIHSRKFEVDYFEQDEHLWRITSRLNDDIHDIRATLDVSVPDMIIRAATLEFVRYPLEGCLLIPPKIHELIGANLMEDCSLRIRQLFLGVNGCPNVMSILGISAPGLIYFYFPDQIRKGNMKYEEWWQLCSTKLVDACIAHQQLAHKYASDNQSS